MSFRISTNTIFESGSARISDQMAALAKTQQQVSSGKRILTPADDPIGAAQVLDLTQSQSLNTQYGANRTNAKNALSLEEGTLSSVTTLLQNVKTQIVEAGNASLDDTQRGFIATALQEQLQQLVGLANSRDGSGNFLFAGYQNTQPPYTATPTGATYNGDQGQQLLQVGAVRQMAANDSGFAVFNDIPAPPGTYTVSTAAANTGTVTATAATVVDATQLTGHNYDIVFSNTGTTYTVFDATLDPGHTGTGVTTGTYTAGQPIAFDGMQLTANGTPVDGDTINVVQAKKQDIFTTLTNLITLLKTPSLGVAGKANLDQGLQVADKGLANTLDNVLGIRASVGARLNEIDSLDANGDDRNVQLSQSLSQIQDEDLAKGISQLTQQQTALQASQQSYVMISKLSLFNFL